MNTATQRIALLAVGIALFVALSMCLQVPVFENYYLCLGYVVMAVYCFSFGTINGTITGIQTFGSNLINADGEGEKTSFRITLTAK
jgi:uncharacterized membrane protein